MNKLRKAIIRGAQIKISGAYADLYDVLKTEKIYLEGMPVNERNKPLYDKAKSDVDSLNKVLDSLDMVILLLNNVVNDGFVLHLAPEDREVFAGLFEKMSDTLKAEGMSDGGCKE